MKKSIQYILIVCVAVFFTACKKEKNNTSNNGGGGSGNTQKENMLVIENGGLTVNPDEAVSYKARLVNKDGSTVTPASLTWSTSNSDVVVISSTGVATLKATGFVTVTATATYNGATFTATAPLQIATPGVFAVAPGACLMFPGESIQLNPVYLNASSAPSYSYSTDKSSVATVSSTGVVSAVAAGSATITVNSTTSAGSAQVLVPVLVIGVPDVVLPVVRVDVTPDAEDIFRGDTKQFVAKAYNGNNQEVAGETFTWSVEDPSIASISSSGLVTGLKIGETKVRAVTKGIIGEATLTVNPDTVVVISPFMATIAPGNSQQFNAQAYNAKTATLLSGITNFKWEIPNYPVPGFEIFNIGTVSPTGLVNVKPEAIPGISSFVIAYIGNNPDYGSAAPIIVGF
jgi:uncharacterized protein YjdB